MYAETLQFNVEYEATYVGHAANADKSLSVNIHILETDAILALITVRRGDHKKLTLKGEMPDFVAYLEQFRRCGLVWQDGPAALRFPTLAQAARNACEGTPIYA